MLVLQAALYWAVYVSGWVRLRAVLEAAGVPARATPYAVGLWLAVAVPSVTQAAVPGLLEAGRRDADAIADGEWWRLATSLVLQDGGLLGTVFNLLTLAVTAVLVGSFVRDGSWSGCSCSAASRATSSPW